MAYTDDILALSPSHHFTMIGNSNDSVGAAVPTNTSVVFGATPICEDSATVLQMNATGDSVQYAQIATMDDVGNNLLYAGWFMPTQISQPMARIVGDGNSATSLSILMGFGNNIVFEADDAQSATFQIAGDVPLSENRPYHLAIGVNGSNELIAYLDGVPQTDSANVSIGSTLNARAAGLRFGGVASGTTYSMGGTAILLVTPVNGRWSQWASWNGVIPTSSQIREELFEKGALADVTITSQAELDALANSVRADAPCCIRVDSPGSLSLTADNITFDSKASIHVQYTGSGTLTWTNVNGSNASIGSTTGGGVINFINPAALTIEGVIDGAEVRIYDDENTLDKSYNTELDGVESNSGSTFVFSHAGAVNTIIVQMMATGYEEVKEYFTLSAEDQTLTLFPKEDFN